MEADVPSNWSGEARLTAVSLSAVVSGLLGWTFFTAYIPLLVFGRLDTVWGRFLFYFLPFLAAYGLSHWLFTWRFLDLSTGRVLELGAAYVTVSFWFQLIIVMIWLPLELSTFIDPVSGGYCCGSAAATWINSATSFPLALGKGIALLDRWRGKSAFS